MARYPGAKVHLYAKAERPGRKLGHVTVLGESPDEVRTVAARCAGFLASAQWPDGFEVHGGRRETA
jgi:5-(carboxyamino)imidazole ribonucleotide synthase